MGQAVAQSAEMVTVPDAILCLYPSNLGQAYKPEISKSQDALRRLRCMRTEGGVSTTVLDTPQVGEPVRVLFRPQGIPAGVALWTRASSIARPDIRTVRASR
jgi:hypothetical protein